MTTAKDGRRSSRQLRGTEAASSILVATALGGPTEHHYQPAPASCREGRSGPQFATARRAASRWLQQGASQGSAAAQALVPAPLLVPGLAAAADKGAGAKVGAQHLGVLQLHEPGRGGRTNRVAWDQQGLRVARGHDWKPCLQLGFSAMHACVQHTAAPGHRQSC